MLRVSKFLNDLIVQIPRIFTTWCVDNKLNDTAIEIPTYIEMVNFDNDQLITQFPSYALQWNDRTDENGKYGRLFPYGTLSILYMIEDNERNRQSLNESSLNFFEAVKKALHGQFRQRLGILQCRTLFSQPLPRRPLQDKVTGRQMDFEIRLSQA